MAMLRCLGIKLGYYNTDSAEVAWACDQIMDTWSSVMDSFGAAIAPEAVWDLAVKFCLELDQLLKIVTDRMATNSWKYAAGDSLTCADFLIFSLYINVAQNPLSKFNTKTAAIYAKYSALAPIMEELIIGCASYLQSRPKLPA